jgi:hypothetical protein
MASRARTRRLEMRARKAAALFLRGHRQIDAWRAVTPDYERLEVSTQSVRSSEFWNHPITVKALDDTAREMEVRSIDSHVAFHSHTREREAQAFDAGNLTAASQYQRLRGQSGGFLVENMNMTMAGGGLTPEQLCQRIAELRPDLGAFARSALGLDATPALADQHMVIDVKAEPAKSG